MARSPGRGKGSRVNLKKYLRARMKELGLTHADVAAQMMSPAERVDVTNWLNLKRQEDIPPGRLRDFARILEVGLSEVLEHEDPDRLVRIAPKIIDGAKLVDVVLQLADEEEL